jgi:hypothetical protein
MIALSLLLPLLHAAGVSAGNANMKSTIANCLPDGYDKKERE